MQSADAQILKHESIKLSKREYYHRNSEIQKLKSLRVYYLKQLQRDSLDADVKE